MQIVHILYTNHMQIDTDRSQDGYILYTSRIQIAYKLNTHVRQLIYKSYTNCIQTLYELFTAHIQIVCRLYADCIQLIYKPYTHCIRKEARETSWRTKNQIAGMGRWCVCVCVSVCGSLRGEGGCANETTETKCLWQSETTTDTRHARIQQITHLNDASKQPRSSL